MKTVLRFDWTSVVPLIVLLVFGLSGTWALAAALSLNQVYQDGWILEGIWLPLSIMLLSYLFYVTLVEKLSHIAFMTSVVAFLLYALPALKYHYVYGSAVDQAAHFDLIRTIALTGGVDPSSVYASTPGFQALVAMLAGISRGSLAVWSKLLPAFLAALIPLAFYMLCRRLPLPPSPAKLMIVLSAFSLPLLYRLNGTTFTVPLAIFLIVFFFLRLLADHQSGHRLSYTLLLLLLLLAIIFWHPSTSLVISFTLIFSGLFFSLFPTRTDTFLPFSATAASLGLICLITALTYWMYTAGFVWLHFVDNISLALQAEITPNLVPVRVFQISFFDRLVVFSFYHARDAIFLGLSALAILQLLISRSPDRLARFLRTYAVLWLAFLAVLAAVFISDFGAQGYHRFLFYLVALSPPLAAYGLWLSLALLSRFSPRRSLSLPLLTCLGLILFLACLQLFPYQPLMPTFDTGGSDRSNTPVLYLHQVNTLYQRLMLDFAFHQLPTGTQLITDNIGNKQSLLFFDRQTRDRSRRTVHQRPEPAFLLLHWPIPAGPYGEQAEYRSLSAIKAWVAKPNMSKVYDNGGSFILYSPDNAQVPFKLEADQ